MKNRVDYPNHPFGRALADIARMIAAELPTRVFYPTFRTPFTPAGNIARPPGGAPRSRDGEPG